MRIVTFIAISLALAACGEGDVDADGDGKISMEEAAARSGDMIKPRPGRYRATVEMIDIEMPGAAPEVRDMMKGMFASGPQTDEYCLTEEQAEKGFEEVVRQSQQGSDCSFDKFDVSGGDIDAVLVCSDPEQGQARMAMQGTGTETSSDMTMTMEATGPDGQAMTWTMKSQQERIGDCDG